MFRKLIVLFLLLLPGALNAGELKINVQSFPPGLALKPGVAVLLSAEGLEPGQTATWHRVAVEGDVILKLDSYHLFAGITPGPRTFIVQVSSPGTDPFTLTTFEYGGEGDDANPTPPPLPPGEKRVVIVRETFHSTQGTLIAQLAARFVKNSQDYRLFDPQQKEDGKTPAWAQVVIDKGVKQPCIAVVTRSGDSFVVVGVEPLTTLDAATETLQRYGVK